MRASPVFGIKAFLHRYRIHCDYHFERREDMGLNQMGTFCRSVIEAHDKMRMNCRFTFEHRHVANHGEHFYLLLNRNCLVAFLFPVHPRHGHIL